MKKLFTISKNYRIFLFLSLMFFLGIQVRVIAQDIDFNSTSCKGGIINNNTLFNQIGTINAVACNTLSIQSIKLVGVTDIVDGSPSVLCTNEGSCSSGKTVIGIHFPGSGGTPSSYTLTGAVSGDGHDHQIIFKLKATQSDDKSQQESYRMHITTTGAWGDPHITTVDSVGVHYDFQSAGEFITLKAGNGDNFEIQARQTPVATTGPGAAGNNTTGLTTCVSVFTAVAARVGTHRVTYQPNINGQPDSSGMQLRVDSVLTTFGKDGVVDLGSGGRIVKSLAGGGVIEIDFPDGASLSVTPTFWHAYSQWYLNLTVSNTLASKGLMGVIPAGSWLPALPDGSSLGPKPDTQHVRFVALNSRFADAWRVTDITSLFDYAPGTSTATFTNRNWPAENAQSCGFPGQTPLPPIGLQAAEQLCRDIVDPNMRADAIFDVMITGDSVFAKSYLLTQRVMTATTATRVNVSKDTTKDGEAVTFTASVSRKFSAGNILTGSVVFTVDDEKLDTVKLDANGSAVLTTTSLKVGGHQIAAMFIPDAGSTVFSSSSLGVTHTVTGTNGTSIWQQWWFWLLLILALIIIIYLLTRKKKGP